MKNKTSLILIFASCAAIGVFLYLAYFRTVTVSFVAKIGAGVAPVSVRVGQTISEPTARTNEEYEFLGWYLDGEKFDFNTPIKKNVTLEAKWQKVEK